MSIVAKTIGELIIELQKLDPNLTWHGWDDGSIIIEHLDNKETFIDSQEKS